ncbi:hypothetical protein ABZ759_08285 [Streptomyces sp. NPDC047860]|uniref:hypothetical protein n=1 Tax=Streptomyces sp. NPDC047860 TaxID=3155743 RepID=UPI0033EF0A3F
MDGELTLYMERGGKTLLAWPAAPDGEPAQDPRLPTAAEARGPRRVCPPRIPICWPPPKPSPQQPAPAPSARSR